MTGTAEQIIVMKVWQEWNIYQEIILKTVRNGWERATERQEVWLTVQV